MEEQIIEENTTEKKEKKQRKESLLFKYGVIAFLEIFAFISVFLVLCQEISKVQSEVFMMNL